MSNCVILTSEYHRDLEKQVCVSVGVARKVVKEGGRLKGKNTACRLWVGQQVSAKPI